ncbi:MAG: glutamate-5-semialdehyde dehydrogenase [Candidatus Burarchaeum sp.]|nr:glutamate-5-semialdehyde dehydrogenase [Candidatus Burarchaeum sp.]MDO8339248.1 glutamate-5-semialdehyde dehydrogenase [Candidatus Burarchaeum sp.]
MGEVEEKCRRARAASEIMKNAATPDKNRALLAIATALRQNSAQILAANKKDLTASSSLPLSVRKRLELSEKSITSMASGFELISKFPDPVGQVVKKWEIRNGLRISRVRVPLGVIAFIYESRPNVTAEAASLALKSGNAIVLRGGKEAINSNRAIVRAMQGALAATGLTADAVQLIEDTSHEGAATLMQQRGLVDVLIPRGGAGLIKAVVENAKVPVIETGAGNCHVYVDEGADLAMAERIILNSKLFYPYVCNAMEHLLVHSSIASKLLPSLYTSLTKAGVEVRGCERTCKLLKGAKLMTESELYDEYLNLIMGIKIVDNVQQAISHINKYGTHHSDSIITNDGHDAKLFTQQVDSCCVFVNTSTCFSDGYTMGFGGEVGISTQRLHARGPMGLEELTTTKLVIEGSGQVRE